MGEGLGVRLDNCPPRRIPAAFLPAFSEVGLHHHLVLYKTLGEGVAQDRAAGFVLEMGLELVDSPFPA